MAHDETPHNGSPAAASDPERLRLAEARCQGVPWQRWGPYLADRAWGTVREDYSADGAAWDDFPHDHARSRAYRWNEDGLLGISDDQGLLCFGLTLWNGNDPVLKERLFGLTGGEGNHGEDVKEYYGYLDSTPTHSFMQAGYKYPQRAFPYAELVAQNRRSRGEPEYELLDTGVFAEDRYFDIQVTYAKAAPDDILIRITAVNRGPDPAPLHLLPTLWCRNTWSWGRDEGFGPPPRLCAAVNPAGAGTKVAAHYMSTMAPGATETVVLRLSAHRHSAPFADAEAVFRSRQAEADRFYVPLAGGLSADERLVQRQAFAGLLWSKQFYHYDVDEWLQGDPSLPAHPHRRRGRNRDWGHVNTHDILSMPDAWEYPWFASWDLAFHCIPLALIDSEFAKAQLVLLGREWYQHPNGQFAAYEWAFGDVNPPVHAWAVWRVYKIEQRSHGRTDRPFLERMFHKLLLNFTWWVNRKDTEGRNVFQGGFLGLDNIGVFDRSATLPTGGHLDQSDGTARMGMYCLNMLTIALELARENAVYEDVATKFFEHFLYIAAALNDVGGEGMSLWDEADEFFYDVLHLPNGTAQRLKVRSLIGLIPLLAVETIEPDLLAALPQFAVRLQWFLAHRPDLASLVSRWQEPGMGERRLVALVRGHRMKCLLRRMLDPQEFLSIGGVRSLSRFHAEHPYALHVDGATYTVDYQPAESTSELFGGNSNWRGPVWFPINYLLIEALQKFHHYYGDDFLVECPTGSGRKLTLQQIAEELSGRLSGLFLRDANGRRPVFGANERWQTDQHWRDMLLFSEYFHGDTGAGLGASHQTGWAALVAKLLEQTGRARSEMGRPPVAQGRS
jgi:hypothetical protein